MDDISYQRLAEFELPKAFRGRSAWFVQLWWIVQAILFRGSPQVLYGWRRWLLRIFGAEIGIGVKIRPTVTVTYPWKLSIGDYSWVGDNVVLYTLGKIVINENSVISQHCYLCTGGHDYHSISFDIYAKPIYVEEQVWLAADVFIAPGVTIGAGTVVGARSSVFHDLQGGVVAMGNPAKALRER